MIGHDEQCRVLTDVANQIAWSSTVPIAAEFGRFRRRGRPVDNAVVFAPPFSFEAGKRSSQHMSEHANTQEM